MSHLGDLLSALVDGELSGTELDRANAHVAACAACRGEANALRQLKHELRSLAEMGDPGDITRRLLAMTSQVGQEPQVPVRHLGRGRGPRRRMRASGRDALTAPYPPSRRRAGGRRRRRYMLWSTVSLVVVGIGTAAFGMGGGSSSQAPRVTPQLEVFDAQHAVVSGNVPFAGPADGSSGAPVETATPAETATP